MAVLGPIEVTGWRQAPDRGVVTEVVVHLACHPGRPVTPHRLRADLSVGKDTDITAKTLRTYLSYTRTALGADHLPDMAAGGYRLVDVDCDLTRFDQLVDTAAHALPPEAIAALRDALRLVRGRPFAHAGGHSWVDDEDLATTTAHRIVTAAVRLAGLALATRDAPTATWAATVGVRIEPCDEDLARATLDAAALDGRPDRLARAWRDITGRFETKGIARSADLVAHHRRLADQQP